MKTQVPQKLGFKWRFFGLGLEDLFIFAATCIFLQLMLLYGLFSWTFALFILVTVVLFVWFIKRGKPEHYWSVLIINLLRYRRFSHKVRAPSLPPFPEVD